MRCFLSHLSLGGKKTNNGRLEAHQTCAVNQKSVEFSTCGMSFWQKTWTEITSRTDRTGHKRRYVRHVQRMQTFSPTVRCRGQTVDLKLSFFYRMLIISADRYEN